MKLFRKPVLLAPSQKRTDNHVLALPAKVELREKLLTEISPASVLDMFAGAGEMHGRVWVKAKSYVGCDIRLQMDERRMFCCRNEVLLRSIDLAPYNLFDADAYGDVWRTLIVLAARRTLRPKETIGVAYTDGTPRAMALISHPHSLLSLVPDSRRGLRVYSVNHHVTIARRAVEELARRMRAVVRKHWIATRRSGGGAGQIYGAFVLTGL